MKPPRSTSTADTTPSARTRPPKRFSSSGRMSPAPTRPPQNNGAKWPLVIGCAADPSTTRNVARTSISISIEKRSATSILCQLSPLEAPLMNMISATAAMPVDPPEARNSAPMRRESAQNGSVELLSRTPVYAARKKPKSMPISENFRRNAATASDVLKDSTDDTNVNPPKMPTAQAPSDIGSQNLKCSIMFMKREGTPRSMISSSPHTATSGNDSR